MSAPQRGSPPVLQLIGDVQRFGLLSAATIVEGYVELVDHALATHAVTVPGSPDQADWSSVSEGAARLAEAGVRALETIASLVLNGIGQPTPERSEGRLELPAARPGASTKVTLWVHNPTSAPVTGVDLRVTSLTSSTGPTIAAGAISLSPRRIDVVDAQGCREVRLRVDVPPAQPAGHYHGLVVSSSAPAEALALRLEVLASEGSRP